jgi:hypothetical protein
MVVSYEPQVSLKSSLEIWVSCDLFSLVLFHADCRFTPCMQTTTMHLDVDSSHPVVEEEGPKQW